MEKGNISVQTGNIFPIIKKFLYSDHEIFLRELVSNAVDATTKVKALANRGDLKGELGDTHIDILLDKDQKTLTVRDRGIGMTAEEVKKYLNQVAFSSAEEFLEKYKDESIIGHFGLGFYSAFMVADKVEVQTRSWKDEPGVTWICEGDPEYTIDENEKTERGTDVILYINEENKEFLEESRIESLLHKYAQFLPVPIHFGTRAVEEEAEAEGEEEKEKITREVPNVINNTDPAWKKAPNELTDDDYQKFYREIHPFSPPPLFHIHLNIDYPFNLTGILYFPKLGNNLEMQRNKIQLYSNQVYVTDEVKDIVPEFLTLLHGVIDSPDIPLNVSRSYLQADSNVKKITGYITRKVAEKLKELFNQDRKAFEAKWDDLGVFIKYGMISDEKFYEKANDIALLKDVEGKFYTVEEYREAIKEVQTDKYDKQVFLYTHAPDHHQSYIQACQNRSYKVLVLDQIIDTHFAQHLEYKMGNVTFVRVDSDTVDNLVQTDEAKESVLSEQDQEKVKKLFEGLVEKEIGQVQLKPLSPDDAPVTITRPEFMRRMKEMQNLQGLGADMLPDNYNIVVNTNHPLVAEQLLAEKKARQKELGQYLYDLALLNQGMLKGTRLTGFVKQSLNFLGGKK